MLYKRPLSEDKPQLYVSASVLTPFQAPCMMGGTWV